jgi:MarR family transcriptional repressor of emrRAB
MGFESRLDRLLAGRPADLVAAVTASRMVFRVAWLLETRIDEALAPHGLTMREYLALVLIADDAVEPLRPSDLSVTLDATRTQVTRLLDGLERKKLVRRLPHVEDRRSLQLAHTEEGRALLRRAAPAVHAAYRAAWRGAGLDDTRQALAVLRQVHDALLPEDAR